MAIVYPLSLPTFPGWSKVVLGATNIVGLSRSPFTNQQQVYQWPGEYWSVDISMPPMPKSTAEAWINFLVSLRGTLGTFYIGDVDRGTPRGVATGTPVVNGAQGSMSTTLATKGWTAGVTGIFLAGDFIQLGTGAQQRIYKVLTNANSDGSGNATFDIFPILREGVSNNQPITLLNTQGTFRLISDERKWDMDAAHIYGLDFACEEAL
jgi:hypothetical protein